MSIENENGNCAKPMLGSGVGELSVLSLFDGMSCGQIALERAELRVKKYYASEIDKYAIQVTQQNYPNTIQLGDITKVKGLTDINLLIGGSPCQGLSLAAHINLGERKNLEDERSKLFFEFVRIKKEINPKWFLLENVKMDAQSIRLFSEYMECEPIEINSIHFVPQKRKRLYWTNIPIFKELPIPNTHAHDILDLKQGEFASMCDEKRLFKKIDIFNTLTASYYKGIRGARRPAVSNKICTLDEDRLAHRMLTPTECERLQSVPVGYTDVVSKTQRYKMLGNGWTVDVIAFILSNLKTGNTCT